MLSGWSADFLRGVKCARRVLRDSNAVISTSRTPCRRTVSVLVRTSQAVDVGRSASRVAREDNHAKLASALLIRGQSAGSPRGEPRAGPAATDSNSVATSFTSHCRRPGALSVQRRLGQRRGVERVARWPRRQPRQARNARACSVVSRPVLHGAKRARAARHGVQTLWSRGSEAAVADLARCRCRRAWANGVVARWPRRQPGQLRQRARAAWAVGRFSTGRSALKPRGTKFGCSDHDVYTQLPPTWRGVGAVEPRPTARGGARR